MRIHQPNRENVEAIGDAVGHQVATRPASTHPSDFLNPDQEEVLALLKPSGDRKQAERGKQLIRRAKERPKIIPASFRRDQNDRDSSAA